MTKETETRAVAADRESAMLGSKAYLVEMNDRLTRLRSLVGDDCSSGKRPKRWLGGGKIALPF